MNSPWCSTTSSTQKRGMSRIDSSIIGRMRVDVVAEGAGLLLGAALAEADLEPAVGQDVERRAALGDLDRVVHLHRQADHAVADANALGGAGDVGQEGLRGAHVRVHREGGVLDGPDDVEAHLLGQQRLLTDLAKDLVIALAARIGGLGLVDQGESHGVVLLQLYGCVRAIV